MASSPWHVQGDYLESCNCEAICPCRMSGGVPGGRSTYGECFGLLSWRIADGSFDGTDLSGLNVALACRYHDDEPGSPWTIVFYVDAAGDREQRAALEAIFLGRAGGERILRLPWVRKPSFVVDVRPAEIEFDGEQVRVGERARILRDSDRGKPGRRALRHPGLRGERARVVRGRARGARRPVRLRADRQLRVPQRVPLFVLTCGITSASTSPTATRAGASTRSCSACSATTSRTRASTSTSGTTSASTQASDDRPVTRNLHVAFVARSRADVDAFWQAGVDAGYQSDGEPGERPQYSETYYGGFLLDPDGNSAEAIHTDEPRPGGNYIDHMWIGVSDLDATRRFYETVAPVVGVRIAHARPERFHVVGKRPLFRARARRPPADQNVHLAFGVPDNATVDEFHRVAVAAGYESNGPPGERPVYHAGYYGAFVLDPDGNNVEAVCHNR